MTGHTKLSSDNPEDCVSICFNYDELALLCNFLEMGIASLNLAVDEEIALKADAEKVLKWSEYFCDQFN